MPNYVSNLLFIKGSKEEVSKVLDLIKSEESDFDFNKVIPMPSELDVPSMPTPSEELEAIYQSNIDKYGYKDWYDWCIDKWGTKWNAEDVTVEMTEDGAKVWFKTAWEPPIPIYEALEDLIPDLDGGFFYAECGCGIYGIGLKNKEDKFFVCSDIKPDTEGMWLVLNALGYAVVYENGKWHWEEEEEE